MTIADARIDFCVLNTTDYKMQVDQATDFLSGFKTALSTTRGNQTPLNQMFQSSSTSSLFPYQTTTVVPRPLLSVPLVDRSLYVPHFAFPYSLETKIESGEIDGRASVASFPCSTCLQLETKDFARFKVIQMERWLQRNAAQKRERGTYPLDPKIVQTIQEVYRQLQQDVGHTLPISSEMEPCPALNQSLVSCSLLYPLFQRCVRELQLISQRGYFYFHNHKLILFASGEVGSTHYELHQPHTSPHLFGPLDLPTELKVLECYCYNEKIPQPFHMEIPLRQLILFPKLVGADAKFDTPQYIHIQGSGSSHYLQFSTFQENTKRETIQLIFPYHHLHCLGKDFGDGDL